jgi:flagellar biosynthesis protein FlhF
MNIKRYKAPDMRTAFKQVRAEYGDDVVMLSSRRLKDGIEIVVAIDQALGLASGSRATPVETVKVLSPAPIPAATDVKTPALDQEIRALRRLLESQLAALAWNDLSRRNPQVAEVMRELTEMGFARDLVSELLAAQPAELSLNDLRSAVRQSLSTRLATLNDRWIEQGGTVALVGPAGSGKSAALASIASRWVMRNGAHSAALVSAVESRMGMRENLQRMGRLVSLPVFVADSWQEIPALLRHLHERRLVLIDTPTVPIRQAEFSDYLLGLAAISPETEFALTVSAASQAGAVRDVLQRYKPLGRLAAVITHLDESSSLGGVLSALIEQQIPVAYTQSGSRLLDDLKPARAENLLDRASHMANLYGATADEELMSRRLEVASRVA